MKTNGYEVIFAIVDAGCADDVMAVARELGVTAKQAKRFGKGNPVIETPKTKKAAVKRGGKKSEAAMKKESSRSKARAKARAEQKKKKLEKAASKKKAVQKKKTAQKAKPAVVKKQASKRTPKAKAPAAKPASSSRQLSPAEAALADIRSEKKK
jgi:hypothetical protein